MPTYEYLCDECAHEFELFQQMSDAVKKKCPECGKLKLRRLIGTGAGVLFKGGGFYETDYRSDSYQKAAKAEQESAAPKKSEAASTDGAAAPAAGCGSGCGCAPGDTAAKSNGTAAGKNGATKPAKKAD